MTDQQIKDRTNDAKKYVDRLQILVAQELRQEKGKRDWESVDDECDMIRAALTALRFGDKSP